MKIASPSSRFAHPEWERRFLLAEFPGDVSVVRVRQIVDRYIIGTRLRLRRMRDSDGLVAFKLSQKLNEGAAGAFQGQLTTIYLTEAEYDVLAALPSRVVEKTRHTFPRWASTFSRRSLLVSSWPKRSSVPRKKPPHLSRLRSSFRR